MCDHISTNTTIFKLPDSAPVILPATHKTYNVDEINSLVVFCLLIKSSTSTVFSSCRIGCSVTLQEAFFCVWQLKKKYLCYYTRNIIERILVNSCLNVSHLQRWTKHFTSPLTLNLHY